MGTFGLPLRRHPVDPIARAVELSRNGTDGNSTFWGFLRSLDTQKQKKAEAAIAERFANEGRWEETGWFGRNLKPEKAHALLEKALTVARSQREKER